MINNFMRRFLFLLLLLVIGSRGSFGQKGAQTLRLAQSIYEQGRLHELPTLKGMFPKDIAGYSKSEQVNAYRILTLAHIYLEEPDSADVSMLRLLNADHFYEPNAQVEPAEFMGLYRTFRTKPVFGIGLKFGGNFTQPLLNKIYYVSGSPPGHGKYASKFGIQVGLVFEKEIFARSKNPLLKRLIFTPEVMYTNRTFSYSNSELQSLDGSGNENTNILSQTVKLKQTYLDINPVFQLRKKKPSLLNPYYGFGPGVSYLLAATNTMQTQRIVTGDATTSGAIVGPDVTMTSAFRKIVPSLIASAGLKYRFGSIYLMAELRVQYGLMNPVNPSKRTVTSAVFDYNYALPDYKPLNLTANIGFVFPYFNPVKLNQAGKKIVNKK
jgi:hypothetical protein